MKKKALLASAVALVTASAMTFAPVSYKVIDTAYAATPDVEKVADKLNKIFQAMKNEETGKLATAYDALLAAAKADASEIADLDKFPNLKAALPASVDPGQLELALVDLIQTIADEYKSTNAQFNDISADVEGKLDAVKAKLGTLADDVTRDDLAKLLEAIQEKAIEELSSYTYTPGTDYSKLVYDAVLEAVKAEWQTPSNKIVEVLKDIYGAGDFAAFEEDINNAKEKFQQYIEDAGKENVYLEGAAALAISYARYYLDEVERPLQTTTYTGNKVNLVPKFFGNIVPRSLFAWEADKGNYFDSDYVLRVSNYGAIKVTAKLKDYNKLSSFDGVELFSQEITVSSGGGGVGGGGGIIEVAPDLSLVSDYAAKAEAIESKLADYLAKNPELSNNTLVYGLLKQLEEQLRQALLVQSAGAVTVSDGVSTLNVTPEQMSNVYNTQLTTVLKALEDALKKHGVELDPAVVLTYNIGVTSNAEVNLSKALIDSLTSKGIDAVGVKSGDASVEAFLDQLAGTSKVTIKKSAASVAGAKSDVYSIAATDANGQAQVGFEKQYRVTLPVSGNATNVTVAKLADGSQTLIGGQYDPATKTITFYTNKLGDFVVVENSTSFNDTANISWAKDQIQLLADKGILQGRGNGKFDPQGNITRAEFTAILVRTLNLNASTPITFNDVSENAWYYDAVSAARAYGIINGRSASTFDPNAQITREEMASIASNALKSILGFDAPANANDILAGFVDGNGIAAVHSGNVALLANEGIVQGKGNDNYDPKGNATRAEVAVIAAKIFNMR